MSSQVETAFADRPDLLSRVRIQEASSNDPRLFEEIASLINNLRVTSAPPSKKRKLETDATVKKPAFFTLKDVGFQLPQRKKATFKISLDGIKILDQTNGEIIMEVASPDIEQIFCLPQPEKQQRQSNFLIIPRGGEGFSSSKDQILFVLPEAAVKNEGDATFVPSALPVGIPSTSLGRDENIDKMMTSYLNIIINPYKKQVIVPDASEFTSAIPQAHRRGEPALYAKANRGSKDGYLFLLPSGMVFGFKKPVLYIDLSKVTAVSYTNILSRTFNMVVTIMTGEDGSEDVEFGMIDQQEYAGIDGWVRKHGLDDQSMAAKRAAQISGKARGDNKAQNGDGKDRYEPGELARAEAELEEQRIQDEEDELEEDYDPEEEEEGGSSEEEDYEEGED
ncbi:MAG: hypothetical protein M1820_007738 [Bogoriella megaspora]|nr:MAG: hypothetical protein M1820_007738 [Bogoriella megaspora]